MATTMTITSAVQTGVPHVRVLEDRCAGCQECVVRCPTGALEMDSEHWVAVARDDACVGCRQCVRTCPFSAIEVEGPVLVTPRVEVEPLHPDHLVGDTSEIRPGIGSWDDALAEAQRCLACPDPTCVRGCPAHNDIPRFVAAIRDRDLATAHRVLRRTSVLPDVCSRVCNQAAQCEGACTWSLAGDTPVAIGLLERFVADNSEVPPPVPGPDAGMSVGVVGSGPGAIGAAWELVEAGVSVTVYERDPVPSGLLGWGIPDFTLPERVADRPWRQLGAAGVDLRLGTDVDAERLEQLLCEHDAVIVATGAGAPLRPPIPGADLDGVTDATNFLKTARAALESPMATEQWVAAAGLATSGSGRADRAAPHVLVLGAGNTAMDVARTARRLGLDATCVDWVDERFALARPDELEEARREGVSVRFLRTVVRLEGDGGRVRRAVVARCEQPRADRPPTVVEGAAETVSVDLVVMAMGYRAEPAIANALPGTPVRRQAAGLPDRRWTASGVFANQASAFAHHSPVGTLAYGREVGMHAAALPVRDRLWVVGDALVGPATVVEAMAHGRRAAAAVLGARPSRPGTSDPRQSRRALVCYASQGGRTARAAQAIAEELTDKGLSVRVLPVQRVGPEELAAADIVVVGSWVEGMVVAKVGPARAMRVWLDSLPPRLGGVPVAVFCTYGVHPRSTLTAMASAFERRGARVVATSSLRQGGTKVAAIAFARRILAGVRDAAGQQTAASVGGR
jgi:glutamate synthase (NADPH/NADH) small chain